NGQGIRRQSVCTSHGPYPFNMVSDCRLGPLEKTCRGAITAPLQLVLLFTVGTIVASLSPSNAGTPTAATASVLEGEATDAFNRAEYDRVLKLWYSLPAEGTASKPLLRLAFHSSLKLGRPEEALPLYQRLVPTDQPDDSTLLRPLALSFL